MKQKTLPILVVALATAMLAVACQKKAEETPAATPPAETATAPAPAVETPPPVTEAPLPATEPTPATTASVAPDDSGMGFEDMDKNKDGGITKDELAPTEMLSKHFSAADKDGDGKLSNTEVINHRAEMAAAKPGG